MSFRSYFQIVITVFLLQAGLVQAGSDDIVGIWNTDDGESRMEIYPCGQQYCGRLVWLKEPVYPASNPLMAGKPKLDRNNADPLLRNQPLLGLQVLSGLRMAEEGLWSNNEDMSYDPASGQLTPVAVKLDPSGALTVRRGSWLLGKREQWQRWQSTAQGSEISPARSAIRALKNASGVGFR